MPTEIRPHVLGVVGGRPAERIRRELSASADELAEGAAVHARGIGRRHLEEAALDDLRGHWRGTTAASLLLRVV
jgi:hypothetical protein